MTLRFRSAALRDVPALVELIESAFRGESSRQGWTTEAHLLDGQRTDAEAVREVITGEASRMVVAEGDGELVGCCQLELRDLGVAYLGMFSVRPNLQGAGVGRAIAMEAERIARDEGGAQEMRITVIRQRGELIAWYERLGYRRTGETAPFPYHDRRFGDPKVDDLEFVVLTKSLV